jgi:hypothetical protein
MRRSYPHGIPHALRGVWVLLLFSLVSLAWAQAPSRLEYRFDTRAVSTVLGGDGTLTFHAPMLKGEPGQPGLPRLVLRLLLPPEADISSVRVALEQAETELISEPGEVKPIPPIAVSDDDPKPIWPADRLIKNGRDVASYERNALTPPDFLDQYRVGQLREWKLVEIEVAPYLYNPVENLFQHLKMGTLVVTYSRPALATSARTAPGPVAEAFRKQAEKIAKNFTDIAPAYDARQLAAAPAQAGGYVILTTAAIQAASTQLSNFVAAKTAQGFTVRVVTEATWGGGTGNVAADRIRAWLAAHYQALNVEYVLLIGNPNPTNGDVPMKMCYPQRSDLAYHEAPSDYYYADLTGNWDLDNDGKYGEYEDDLGAGGADRNYEVIVGRIPYYGSAADLDAILAKTIAYGNASAMFTAWRRRTLLPMEPSDSSTPGYHLGEAIKNDFILPRGGWSYHRVYDETYNLNPTPETTPCTVDNVTNAWNAQGAGAVFWWTHGSNTFAADIMDTEHAATLNNTRPAFTFQCSCLNAYPEDTGNLAYSLLKNGGIGTISGTRVTWYWVGQTVFAGQSSNSSLTYEYAGRLINGDAAGLALHDEKLVITPEHPVMWMNYVDMNLYGDPAVGLTTSGLGTVRRITVVSPNEAETYLAGSAVTIRWGVNGTQWTAANRVRIEVSSNNGATWTTLTGASSLPYNQGVFAWNTAGFAQGSQYRVRVVYTANAMIRDEGDSAFALGALDHFTIAPIASPQTVTVPFPATIAAQTAGNTRIVNYTGAVTVSAAGVGGAAVISPTTIDTFTNGQWQGEMTVGTIGTNMRISVTDTANHTGTSNPFTVQAGPLHHFDWATIASPQQLNAPFLVTLTAKDADGNTTDNGVGPVNLRGIEGLSEVTIGQSQWEWQYPLNTFWHDSRTQVIYQAEELGGSGTIHSLALNVTLIPGQTMKKWTIRMKHTPLSEYPATPSWESAGWTTVYQADETITRTGWVTFTFTTPFVYNGVDNLLIDFCFNNDSYTIAGLAQSTETGSVRSICFETDSWYGDPLNWDPTPEPRLNTSVPNIRLQKGRMVAIDPTQSGPFVHGVWTGTVSVLDAVQTEMCLLAESSQGQRGISNAFTVLSRIQSVALTVAPQTRVLLGQSFTLTAVPTGGTNLEYLFKAKYYTASGTLVWVPVRGWGVAASCVWKPGIVEDYVIYAYAREQGTTYSKYGTRLASVVASLSAVAVTITPTSPKPIGTTLTLKAVPTGGTNLEYLFKAKYYTANGTLVWVPIRDWGAGDSSTWTPAILEDYTVYAYAREAGSGTIKYGTKLYTITTSLTAVELTVTPAVSPPRVGTALTLTATSTGGVNLEYLFKAKYTTPGGTVWVPIRAYGPESECVWIPAVATRYTIYVYVREVGSTAAYQKLDYLNVLVWKP